MRVVSSHLSLSTFPFFMAKMDMENTDCACVATFPEDLYETTKYKHVLTHLTITMSMHSFSCASGARTSQRRLDIWLLKAETTACVILV